MQNFQVLQDHSRPLIEYTRSTSLELLPTPIPPVSRLIPDLENLCAYNDIESTALNIIIDHFGEDGVKNNPIENHNGRYTPTLVDGTIKARG